jgi:hypothetical protein
MFAVYNILTAFKYLSFQNLFEGLWGSGGGGGDGG